MNRRDTQASSPPFPWEREGPARKTAHTLPPRPLACAKIRSKPRIAGQEYLDVYLKSMEKVRLAMLGRVFGRLLGETSKRWESADRKMRQIQESLRAGQRGPSHEADQTEICRGG